MQRNYPAILSVMNVIRDGYIDQILRADPTQPPRFLTVSETRTLLRALIYLPHYLVNRGTNPVPARGVLPEPLLIISNAANGSLRALEGSQDVYGATPNGRPDEDKMIQAIEQIEPAPLVGEKTVCVASTGLMRHFFRGLIDGMLII